MSNSTKHAQGHDLSRRTVRVAALLAERFLNPYVAAYNRSRGGMRYCGGRYIVAPSTKRRELFWFGVGCALTAAYCCRGMRTDYELSVLRAIESERAAIAKAQA